MVNSNINKQCWLHYALIAVLVHAVALYSISTTVIPYKDKNHQMNFQIHLMAQAPLHPSQISSKQSTNPTMTVEHLVYQSNTLKNTFSSKDSSEQIETKKASFHANNRASLRVHGKARQGQDESTVLHKAEYIYQTVPKYPKRAWELGQEGLVILHVLIGIDGLPKQCKIHSSSKHKLLDEAALTAVREWEFKPKTVSHSNAKLSRAWVRVPIRFSIDDS